MDTRPEQNQGKLLSFLMPSRERFDLLLESIEHVMQSIPASEHSKIEFLVKIDDDDTESISRLKELPTQKYDIQILISGRLGGYKDLFRFYNRLARLASGVFLMCWNDDAKFKTTNWYELFCKEVTSAQSVLSYWFGGTQTTVYSKEGAPRTEDWPCFIAHHRKLYNSIGFYSGVGGVDSFLYYVLQPLGLFKQIKEIEIAHESSFDIPIERQDSVTKANNENGQMLPTDFQVVRLCQERIVQAVRVEQQRQQQLAQKQAQLQAQQQQQNQQQPAQVAQQTPQKSPAPQQTVQASTPTTSKKLQMPSAQTVQS